MARKLRTGSLGDRLHEAREQGWLGEVAAIETTLAATVQKLDAMRALTACGTIVHLGMPDIRRMAGRSTSKPDSGSPT